MKWIKEFVSNVALRIRYMKNTLILLMAQRQGILPSVENASENTKKNTETKNEKKNQGQ